MDAKRQRPPIVEDSTYYLVTPTHTNARTRMTYRHAHTDNHALTDMHTLPHILVHTYYSNLVFVENIFMF